MENNTPPVLPEEEISINQSTDQSLVLNEGEKHSLNNLSESHDENNVNDNSNIHQGSYVYDPSDQNVGNVIYELNDEKEIEIKDEDKVEEEDQQSSDDEQNGQENGLHFEFDDLSADIENNVKFNNNGSGESINIGNAGGNPDQNIVEKNSNNENFIEDEEDELN